MNTTTAGSVPKGYFHRRVPAHNCVGPAEECRMCGDVPGPLPTFMLSDPDDRSSGTSIEAVAAARPTLPTAFPLSKECPVDMMSRD